MNNESLYNSELNNYIRVERTILPQVLSFQ